MQFLSYKNNKGSIIPSEYIKEYSQYQSDLKMSFVLACDLASYIKIKGPVPLSTVRKMVDIDLKRYEIPFKDQNRIKMLIFDTLSDKFNITIIDMNSKGVDDKEFLEEYKNR